MTGSAPRLETARLVLRGHLLRSAHTALPPRGLVVVAEVMLDPGKHRDPAALMDLYLMVVPGGQKRSPAQHQVLLGAAGFVNLHQHQLALPGGSSLGLVWGSRP